MAADSLPPLIAAQLNHLISNSPHSIKVDQVRSGCKNGLYSDRFTLLIPFCLDFIKWDFIFNALYPSVAPDVVFSPDDDDFCPLVGEEDDVSVALKNSLVDWNSKDSTRLLELVHKLRDAYVNYQRKRVGELDDARLKFEISTVFSREGIEVCLVSGPDKPEEVKFSVPLLDTSLNQLVIGCPWKNEQKIYLQVIFPIIRSYSSTPAAPRLKLVSTSELKSLFSIEDVKLPPWLDGMCMAEYLPALEDNLQMQVVEAVASIGARRRFIEALAPLFGRPLEADPVFCRKATVVAVSGTFNFLVSFSFSTQFPKQQPTLALQSCQHFTSQGVPLMSSPINDYPWSPRWDTPQMAERIFEFLIDECLNFKKHCQDTQQV
ncbi:BRISC and BRCA1-A complex member 2 [Dioscorea cayenensis subsp. rotundata]|uniref:BRISC and BRCA1-A complex member 2 n=1 Tax=Dioscorea cayennensis subsp. rotundata TaxID=55577 RepID=A0AB40C8S4_DIOCR|nr:BRISC and BRCA1-A complex member 2 [Dioscorea cayenensis subsp. rotundata]